MPVQFALYWLVLVLSRLVQESTTPLPDNDFAPMLLPLMLIAIAICLVLMGIGVALALAGMACVAMLVALGVVSSSAFVALLRRRVFAGVRSFHYQICAVAAAPAGVTLLWTTSALFHLQMRPRSILALGALAGIVAGLSMAGILDWATRAVYRRLLPGGAADRLTAPAVSSSR